MIIFGDMDGVLSDFDKYIIETHDFGDKKTWNDQWSKLPDHMFFELDKMPDAEQLMEYVSAYDPQFLTAIPKHKEKQKRQEEQELKKLKMEKDKRLQEDELAKLKEEQKILKVKE